MEQSFLDWVSNLLQSDQSFKQTFFLAVIIMENIHGSIFRILQPIP